jgi:CBS domain containing-hemolysin-like protein
MSIILFALLVFLLLSSAFFSGAEAAFFSLNRVQLRRLAHDTHHRSRRVLQILARPGDLLTTLLVGNTLVNVAVSVVTTSLFLHRFGGRGLERAILVSAVAVLILGEVTPKTLAVNFPEVTARAAVDLYRVVRIILAPLVAAVSFLSDLFLRALRLDPLLIDPHRVFSRSELGSLLEGADAQGMMTAHESRLVQNILEFSSTRVEEVMTPRIDVTAAPENLEREKLEELVAGAKHSRIPLYRSTIDHVVGYLPVRDFLLHPEQKVAELIRPVAIFPERALAARVFYEIQKNRTPMVIVVNEYGETVGLLTREDLVEEVVGDIYDEYEQGQAPLRRLGPDLFVADGQVKLEELGHETGLEFPTEEALTLNGFLSGLRGGIPRRGEQIRWNGAEFTILETARHRIQRCQIRLESVEEPPADPELHGGKARSGEEWA